MLRPVPGETVLVIDDSPTILKVVQLVLTKAGFKVHTATDGEEGVTKARETKPALILLDFVMPKMNGYQVCRALADVPELRGIPVVLMSAKGDQVGERFVKVMGIVDYITKPFSPDAITALVHHTIEKHGVPGGASEAAPAAVEELQPTGPTPAERRARILGTLREALIDELSRVEGQEGLAEKLRARLDDATLEQLVVPTARDLAQSDDDGVALRGNLGRVPIVEVLTLLEQQRQTGVLSIDRASDNAGPAARRVDIFFKHGRIELALANGLGEEFQLGRYLVDLQLLAQADLDAFLEEEKNQPRDESAPPLGERLVKQAKLRDTDLKQGLAKQAAERIYELLRWPAGRFAFAATRELPPLAINAALGLDVEGVLMEGFRRVDEWHLIEREIDDFDAVFLRNEEAVQQVGRAKLLREELAILELVTGKNSVKDIVRLSRMSSFDVSKLLFRLLSIKLIRRRIAPVAV
jgi:CheY-like chemotaxis protein